MKKEIENKTGSSPKKHTDKIIFSELVDIPRWGGIRFLRRGDNREKRGGRDAVGGVICNEQ